MILNILHRPDKPERRSLFELEQRYAHENGIRTTILVTAEAMADPEQVALVKREAAEHGDEIGLSFHGLTHPFVTAITGYGQEALWLFSREHKRAIIASLAERFAELFGSPPTSVASYHLDSSTMALVREIIPSVRGAVAGCFEEGVRVFHGCNHSWYLFNEGMPWGPWYPSTSHTLRPASDENDWCGIVAVPHLMRDMVLSYEGRNDFWASHPPNVMRGMGYEGEECPYDRNLIDLFRWQERFNDGYSYYNSFVSTAWLAEHHAIDDAPEVAQSLYRQQLEYLGALTREGAVQPMTLTEFADWFREHRRFGEPELYFAKELLYGSRKHYVWYLDADQRVLVDATQGGSIGDLRPYAGRVPVETGPESPHKAIGSYPYVIQSQHRTGMQNHFQDGARTTAIVTVGEEQIDMGTLPTRVADARRSHDESIVRLEPVTLRTADGSPVATVLTRITFARGGVTRIARRFTNVAAPLTLTERAKVAPGVTEYPADLAGAKISVSGATNDELGYRYDGRVIATEAAESARAQFASIHSSVTLSPYDGGAWDARGEEGHLFSPYVTLSLSRTITTDEESQVCLTVARA